LGSTKLPSLRHSRRLFLIALPLPLRFFGLAAALPSVPNKLQERSCPALRRPFAPFHRGVGEDVAHHGGRLAEGTGSHRTAGWDGGTGLSVRALRARSTAHLPDVRSLRSAPPPVVCALPPHPAGAAREMRRGGSRKEPALSPRVGDSCAGETPRSLLHAVPYPFSVQSPTPSPCSPQGR